MTTRTDKLDQLTSLRFFAAFMIVIHHSVGLFGIRSVGVNFGQGVSFFFVLSGFILTYVYPSLDSWQQIKKFWRARIARIWPAYVASFLLGLGLLHYHLSGKTAVANLLMVQAWVPLSTYYFSYNAVAWSVSTEMFFYLAFPALLIRWSTSWLPKIIISGAILISLMVLSKHFSLPDYGSPLAGNDGQLLTQHGLLYINPLSRIFEFIFGMCIVQAWRWREVKWSNSVATIYELGAVALCVLSMYFMNTIAGWSSYSPLGAPLMLWVVSCGSMFAFGALIYVMAHGRGKISKLLTQPFLVVLGEISFSLYLIHQIFLSYYRGNISWFSYMSDPVAFGVFLIILMLSSYLMWTLIEMPGRRLLLGAARIHGTETMKKSWQEHLILGRKELLAGLALCCIFYVINFLPREDNSVSEKAAADITPASLKSYAGAEFGDLFALRGLDIQCVPTGLLVKLAWQSEANQSMSLTNAIHLTNEAGEILGQADYKQSGPRKNLKRGDIWLDSFLIQSDKISANVKNIAIGLYDQSSGLLPINQAHTDWGGHRLVIPIDRCSKTQ